MGLRDAARSLVEHIRPLMLIQKTSLRWFSDTCGDFVVTPLHVGEPQPVPPVVHKFWVGLGDWCHRHFFLAVGSRDLVAWVLCVAGAKRTFLQAGSSISMYVSDWPHFVVWLPSILLASSFARVCVEGVPVMLEVRGVNFLCFAGQPGGVRRRVAGVCLAFWWPVTCPGLWIEGSVFPVSASQVVVVDWFPGGSWLEPKSSQCLQLGSLERGVNWAIALMWPAHIFGLTTWLGRSVPRLICVGSMVDHFFSLMEHDDYFGLNLLPGTWIVDSLRREINQAIALMWSHGGVIRLGRPVRVAAIAGRHIRLWGT